MKFIITPEKTVLKELPFKTGNREIEFIGFDSKVKDLVLKLAANDGSKGSKSIYNTSQGFSMDISEFDVVWFEYTFTDKVYEVNLIINK